MVLWMLRNVPKSVLAKSKLSPEEQALFWESIARQARGPCSPRPGPTRLSQTVEGEARFYDGA